MCKRKRVIRCVIKRESVCVYGCVCGGERERDVDCVHVIERQTDLASYAKVFSSSVYCI